MWAEAVDHGQLAVNHGHGQTMEGLCPMCGSDMPKAQPWGKSEFLHCKKCTEAMRESKRKSRNIIPRINITENFHLNTFLAKATVKYDIRNTPKNASRHANPAIK